MPPTRDAPSVSASGAMDRPAADRTLSDFGFGASEPAADLGSGLYSPVDEPVASTATRRAGGLHWGWVLVFLVALVGVFAGSFYLSGYLTEAPGAAPETAVEDVSGTDLPPGFIALDASPWAEIVSVEDGGGESEVVTGAPFTPKRWALPPGRYRITLRHPASVEPQTVEIEVETGRVTRRHVDMNVDLAAVVKEGGW